MISLAEASLVLGYLECYQSSIPGGELLLIGFFLFVVLYILLRLLSERGQHKGGSEVPIKRERKPHNSDKT